MKVTIWTAGLALAASAAASGWTSFGGPSAARAGTAVEASPAKVDDFMLADQQYLAHQLYRMKDARAVVLITTGAGDPAVRENAAAYMALKRAYEPQGVELFMLDSNLTDRRETLIKEAAASGLDMPILFDAQQLVGEQLGVARTAEVIVVDPKTWRIAYRGPVAGGSNGASAAREPWAADALDAVIAGRPVTIAHRPATGRPVDFPERRKAASFANISYARTVAPIIQEKCADCHQAGGIGPMALTSYEQIKGFSPMIREVLRTKRMPPYMADESVGHFQDDKRLSPDQIKTLVHWIEAGSPRGEGGDPMKKVKFAVPEWPLGKPDLVLDIPAYNIPATGIVDYQRPFVVNPLNKPVWLRASTLKVSDRQAVHHILTGLMETAPNGAAVESKWGSSVGQYAVGSESVIAPRDHGTYIPVGGAIGFQNHYTPYGKATTERSQMALYFYKDGEAPKYVMHNIAIADPTIMIGPNEPHHPEIAYLEFPNDAILFGAFPHSHYRGDSANMSILYPDGREELLLALPKYNFNWQREYTFATPLKVPAGSKIITRYTFDNSTRNPANPDPNRTVPWGDQSFDEMMYTSLRYRWVDETSSHLLPQYDAALHANQMMGVIDDNMDGKIQLAELKGAEAAVFRTNFAQIDQDHDGVISRSELAAAMAFMSRRKSITETAARPAAAAAARLGARASK